MKTVTRKRYTAEFMSNHYNLLLETPEANLVVGMKWFQGTYSIRFNLRREKRGHVFQGRYKAVLVDPEERSYLPTVSDYIHLNPVRAGLLERGADLAEYR
jgi:REP element-mobilizing transposase RayT